MRSIGGEVRPRVKQAIRFVYAIGFERAQYRNLQSEL